MLDGIFSTVCSADIQLDPGDGRKEAFLDRKTRGERAWIYHNTEDVQGRASVVVKPGKKLEHNGIKVELIGRVVDLKNKQGKYDFFSISKDLEPPGTMFEAKNYEWSFKAVEFSNETYRGTNVQLRYFARVSVMKNYAGGVRKETDLIVQHMHPLPELNNSLRMEVGIDECMHIEFEYEKQKYFMNDVVIGKVYFMLMRIKIKHMELNIIRRETVGSGSNMSTENETLTKFEIMDGTPVRDQCVPVRLHLKGLDLTPSYKNVQNKFTVQYLLNLVLVDGEERRYFKQQEIFFYMNKIG